jgi:hypothetical protein
MTLQEMLSEFNEIKSRYPIGTEPARMDPEDGHRMAHLQKAITQKAATNQKRMTDLLYKAESQTQQPALFAADLREAYEVLSPDFDEEGEGVGFRIHRMDYETHVTIDPIRRNDDTGQPEEHPGYLGGITLTFAETVRLIEELSPLVFDQHPCAVCRGSAAPGQELCPACQRDEEEYQKRIAVYDLT